LELVFTNTAYDALQVDIIAVGAGNDFTADLADLDALFDGNLSDWIKTEKFEGKVGTTLKFPTSGALQAPTLLIVGTGNGDASSLKTAAGHAGLAARRGGADSLALCFGTLTVELAQTVAESALAGNYCFDRYKNEEKRRSGCSTLTINGIEENAQAQANASIRASWQNVARDLVNLPPADLYPETLADEAKKLARFDHVEVEIWDFERCKAEGCVGIVAVGQGSARPGCLIHIKYNPPGATGHVAFVGKGVTFDSGGLSLKPSSAMQTMRCDMAGSATVLAATGAVAELGLNLRVDTFIGAVENMNSANAYKLGDILRYNNGVTVEIHNTDAEGRLVLADCLLQACQTEGVTHVIDAATLTGACVVALGGDFTGAFTDDDALYGDLAQCAELEGEGLWRLPLHKPYAKMLKSEWADIKNVGGRAAGATTAALFLQNFVEGVSWVHLDVAGAAFSDKASSFYESGATGQMVRTLTSWVAYRAENC